MGLYAGQINSAPLGSSVTMQNAAVATGVGTVLPTSGEGVAVIAISGTFSATITFEGQAPDGNWYTINALQRGAGVISTTTTTTGLFEINCRGLSAVRTNITAYTSGSVTSTGQAQPLTTGTEFVNAQLTGSNTQQVTLLNAATATGRGSDQPVGGNKTFTFEVFGTATSFTLQVEGKSISGTPFAIQVTNLNNMTSSTSITASGVYQVDVTGLVSVDANLTAVSGGNVTAQGKLVAS